MKKLALIPLVLSLFGCYGAPEGDLEDVDTAESAVEGEDPGPVDDTDIVIAMPMCIVEDTDKNGDAFYCDCGVACKPSSSNVYHGTHEQCDPLCGP